MYRNIQSLCCTAGTNIVLQVNYTLSTNELIEKVIRFVFTRDGGWVEWELNEGSQKVQTSSDEINKY